ncbi:MAG: VIT domain-containing protein [Thermoguttaceae bacterium]|jgi:tetratricopeptide (TPR) repeat protein
MDNEPRRADDLPDEADLSGPLRDAIEQIRREEPSQAMLARVLERARQIAPLPSENVLPSPRRHRMFTLAVRALTAAAAAAALIGVWLYNQATTTAAADLGTVLSRTSAVASLELKITQDGKTGAVWVRGRKLRRNLPDGTYQIARDGKSWLVDEKANRASVQAASYFRGEAGGVDLLALLDLPSDRVGQRQKELLATRPAEHATRDGRAVEIYRWQSAGPEGTLRIDAVVDAKTQLLQSIESLRVRGIRTEPICKLTVLVPEKPVDEDLFIVGDTLTEDGRIGKVTDAQGLVAIRPVMQQRWSPVTERMPIRPGDWLQTDPHGANAASVRLVPQTELVIGPGSTVELSSPRQFRIAEGEIKIKAASKSPIELVGPDGKKLTVAGTCIYRADRGKLVKLDKDPRWLLSYEGKAAGESLGSLLAKIDGRNVPLTVGYHKVTVDIRDQIARTTIEESFVNHTNAQLEGTFFFPLPQDASIAEFGMWIGDELNVADVVEKERAREIYETILRERRDPGLLEWSGGNIFKARVFPIPAQAEKRITITYTQVLPMRGNNYRYQYALQSELLKQHPLRQLEIDVKISSAERLQAVSSPTHLTRNALTAHSAHVEFSAKEYTPTQDFEALVEVQPRQSDVVLVPHRRGDDGYFMVQVTPPGTAAGEGQLQREVLPDGEPIELVLLADTSASMDAPSRQRQVELVAALLTALAPKDKFNLATCDVDCQWVFARSTAAEAKNVEMARQKLAARRSLGWTDLDKAVEGALAQCGPKTQVVYIGDGIVTTGDADPVAFTKRLRRMVEERTHHAPRDVGGPRGSAASGVPHAEREECGTFHSVAVSSSFEPGVLKAIAAIGGGSFRQVSGSQGPAAVALELLGEITQPAIRDMKIEFRGLRTARVYPDPLPNLPLGMQQIILGRYAPQGKDQTGEVLVSGTQGGKPVKFSAKVSLKDAEEGNSFIPRLWARMHLDTLLEQGGSQAVKDEIIALSEEYHIITPYTSLLVLETDADRERFGVKRRFQMRDGEKFFAEGRENANWELIQQQMKRAGTWRLGLRREVLRQFSRLGRDVPVLQAVPGYGWAYGRMAGGAGYGGGGSISHASTLYKANAYSGGTLFLGGADISAAWSENDPGRKQEARLEGLERGAPFSAPADGVTDLLMNSVEAASPVETPAVVPLATLAAVSMERTKSLSEEEDLQENDKALESKGELAAGVDMDVKSASLGIAPLRELLAGDQLSFDSTADLGDFRYARRSLGELGLITGKPVYEYSYRRGGWGVDNSAWLNNVFGPPLPPPPVKPQEPKQPWPAEGRKVARSLLRTEQLTGVQDGLHIEIQTESFDARWDTLTGRSQTRAIVAPQGWLTVSTGDASQTSLAWADAQQRGSLAGAMLLGRERASKPADLRQPPLDLGAGTTSPLDLAYPGYSVELKPEGENRALLILKHPSSPRNEIRILVDTVRHVIVKIENIALPSPSGRGAGGEGKVNSTTIFGDFVEVAGAWYAGRIENIGPDGHRNSTTTQKFTTLGAGQFDRQWKQDLAIRQQSQLLREPLPRLVDAKKALAAGKATFEDQMVMLLHFQATQQWDRVLGHLAEAEKLSGKPGMRWVRLSVLPMARKGEEAKMRYLAEAESLAKRVMPRAVADKLFLADYLVNNSNSILEANEQLRLLEAVRPVYERQPAHVLAMKRWNQSRCNLLERTGQSREVLALRKQLAADYPHDYGLQQQYARALANVGEFPAAYAWLDRVLVPESKWLPYEEEYLVTTHAELLGQQGRYDDLVEYLAAWVKRNPPARNIYAHYLGALVWSDHLPQADDLVAQWIRDAQQIVEAGADKPPADALPGDVDARLRAAVALALGQGQNLYTNRIEPKWFKPLADAAICFARHPSAGSVADQIMGQYSFQQSDECRRVRKAALRMLLDTSKGDSPVFVATKRSLGPELGQSPELPVEQLQRLLNWIDPIAEEEAWQKIAAGLRGRWNAEPDWQVKNQLGAMLARVLHEHIGVDPWLAFLRTQLTGASEEQQAGCARQLFDALLGQPWKQAYEDEVFGLLPQIAAAEQASQRRAIEIAALCQMTDTLVQARFQDRMKAVAHPEKLTRTEFRAKQEENLRLARENYADRLHKEMSARPGPLVPWMNIERLYLDVQAGRNLDKVAEECFELLPAKPRALAEHEADAVQQRLDDLFERRCLVTLMNLAARKGAKAGLAERVLAYLEAGDKAETEDTRWKALQYEFLVALDRPKDLAKRLRAWVAADDADNGWRLTLGYLEAETGQIPAAIPLFEAVRASDELRGADYRTLADWYMAVNRRDAYDRARIDAYKVVEEYQLSRWLYAKVQPWLRSYNGQQPPPRELDVEVLFAFTALFEKAGQPQNYLYQLGQFYATTRDFRLLAGLSDAVLGHTAGQVYPFLQNMSNVLGEVRDEATADSIIEHIVAVRSRAKTEVDRRALDLLEMLVERRAAELQNQPGPHVQRALTAMRRAWKHEWSSGEPRLMAELLTSLGRISQQPLADEQVSELEALHRDVERGAADRLKIAKCLAQTYWAYSHSDRAIDLLTESLDEYQAACGGVLPTTANDVLDTLINYLENRTQHARGEKILQEQLKHPANQQQTYWLVQRLYQLYDNAIARDGDVSLGRGVELYRTLEKKLHQELDTPDQNYRYSVVSRLIAIYRTAHGKKLPGVAGDLRSFAFARLPDVLKRQTNNYTSMVAETAIALHDVAGPRDGMAFLIQRIESEPGWFRLNNQDGWVQCAPPLMYHYSYTLGLWRNEVKDLGDLEKPLLKIVLNELRRDLHLRQPRNRVLYAKHNGYFQGDFWSEKEPDFARTADEVWAADKQSGAACQYIAEYLYWGLDHYPRAIEILLDAHRREVLDEGGQSRLVEFLRYQNRFAETTAILEPLVQRRRDNLQYRVWLMNAYFKTGKPQQLATLLKETHDYFHQDNRWNENAMAMLGRSCLENAVYQAAVDYLQEAIALHQRTAPRRGIGDGTLSGYYGDQARAFAGLKKTPEAVDAAAAAVVSWGRNINNRNNALEALRAVLRAAPDLDACVIQLDKRTAETRQENPILRKAIGQVYREKEQFGKAIEQLRIAAEVQPNDAETHQALLACYDRRDDQQGAVEQLFAWRQLAPRDIKLYEDLGKRLEKLGQAGEVERAYTSIVEVLPAESESHQLLAEIRQRQDRWADAVGQWEQVARIRSLEPTGLAGLAHALIHEHRHAEAADVLTRLKQKNWPARFNSPPENLGEKIRSLEQELQQGRK